jgi:hypothetical protein
MYATWRDRATIGFDFAGRIRARGLECSISNQVEEGNYCLANENTEFLPDGGKRRPCRDDGDGEFDRFCASVRKGDRDCNIEPPASPYAIMRRVYPYRGENSGPGKDGCWRA